MPSISFAVVAISESIFTQVWGAGRHSSPLFSHSLLLLNYFLEVPSPYIHRWMTQSHEFFFMDEQGPVTTRLALLSTELLQQILSHAGDENATITVCRLVCCSWNVRLPPVQWRPLTAFCLAVAEAGYLNVAVGQGHGVHL